MRVSTCTATSPTAPFRCRARSMRRPHASSSLGKVPVAALLSEAQSGFLRDVVKAWPLPSDLRALGPISNRVYSATSYDVDVSTLPDGGQYAEIADKVPLDRVPRERDRLMPHLARAEVEVCARQRAGRGKAAATPREVALLPRLLQARVGQVDAEQARHAHRHAFALVLRDSCWMCRSAHRHARAQSHVFGPGADDVALDEAALPRPDRGRRASCGAVAPARRPDLVHRAQERVAVAPGRCGTRSGSAPGRRRAPARRRCRASGSCTAGMISVVVAQAHAHAAMSASSRATSRPTRQRNARAVPQDANAPQSTLPSGEAGLHRHEVHRDCARAHPGRRGALRPRAEAREHAHPGAPAPQGADHRERRDARWRRRAALQSPTAATPRVTRRSASALQSARGM